MSHEKNDPLAHKPFSFSESKDDRVQIWFEGRIVKTLRGKEAVKFINRVGSPDSHGAQLIMAKVTGQFKFGNER